MRKTSRKPLIYWLRLAVAGVIFALLLYFPVMAYMMVRPTPSPIVGPTPAEWGAVYEDITLTPADGIELKGWYIPSQNGAAVILLHGYSGNRLQMLPHAQWLSQAGYGVLLYDQRASGESGGRWRTWGWQDVDDLSAAIAFIHSDPNVQPGHIGVFGASTGAEIALQATARYTEITAVIADGPGFSAPADVPPLPTWPERLNLASVPLVLNLMALYTGTPVPSPIIETLPTISPRPVLIISTGSHPEKIQAEFYMAQAGPGAEHWHIPEAVHTLGFLSRSDEFASRTVDFFNAALLSAQ